MTSEDIKNKVLEKIRHGDIHARPKIYFILQLISVVIVGVLAIIASSFVVSFAFFSIYKSGELFLLGFGFRGLITFISLFPWIMLVIAGLLVFLFEWLMRHFKFNYRFPLLYLTIFVIFVVLVFGFLISVTPLHDSILNIADKKELPFFGGMYEGLRMPKEDHGEFRGVVVSISTSTIAVTHNDLDNDTDDGTRNVSVPLGFDLNSLHVGDRVYFAGKDENGVISAYGLHKF